MAVMRASDLPQHYNAAEILTRNLAERSEKVALLSVERSLTFSEIDAEANRVGNGLRRLGVRYGDTVALLCLDQPEWVTTFFGTLKVGAVSVGMSTLLTSAEISYILNDCRARVLIVHESLLPLLNRQSLPFLKHTIAVGNGAFVDWISAESPHLTTVPTHREDYATLNYSSGTTGQPKGILHAHKDLPLISEYWGKNTLGLRASDRTFAGAKLFFTYGTGGNLLFPFYVGASIVLFSGSPRQATNLLEIIDRFQPTIFYNSPTGYAIALALPNFEERYNLSSLRLCVSGGENLPEPIWQQWKARTGVDIINGIGCTEVYHNFISNSPADNRPGSSGKRVAGFELRIVDAQGNDLPDGETGNLLVNGDTLALSYLHQYARSRQTFLGEWFSTGDQFRRDADGYYYHMGRSDDMLKVGGIWVSPMEVESALISHPSVVECAVVAWRDADGLVKPKAYVVLVEGISAEIQQNNLTHAQLAKQLINHCCTQIAAYKRPRQIAFVSALPKTATGKIQRFKLRQ